MNLKKGKFKIVEGTRVRMVSSKDTHIVEGAYGTVVSPGIRESEVRWDSMLAIRVYIEEYSADVENEVSPDKDILENGFSRQVTFYEKD